MDVHPLPDRMRRGCKNPLFYLYIKSRRIIFVYMKAKVILLTNYKEIQNAKDQREILGITINIPEEKKESFEILFNIEDVKVAYMNERCKSSIYE